MLRSNHSFMRKRISVIAIILASLLVTGWIAFHNSSSKPAKRPEGHPQADSEEVERLRSLGYLQYAPGSSHENQSGVVQIEPGSYPGYNLYTSAFQCSSFLMDEKGNVINYWQLEEGCDRWFNVKLMENGDLLVPSREASVENHKRVATRRLVRYSWHGDLLWRKDIPVHHVIDTTPSGDLLTLITEPADLPEFPGNVISDNKVVLLSETGVLKEAVSLLNFFQSHPEELHLSLGNKREKDIFHANTAEWIGRNSFEAVHPIYTPSTVLLTIRHQDAVIAIHWPRKKLVWSWGPGEILGPHDAHLLSNGNLLIFDNGLGRGWSRVIELNPVTRKIVWQYKATPAEKFYSASRGTNQRLPNGNTLIAESDKGRAFEVRPDGKIVWMFYNPLRNQKNERATITGIRRYEKAFIDLLIQRLGKGRSIDIRTSASRSKSQPATGASAEND